MNTQVLILHYCTCVEHPGICTLLFIFPEKILLQTFLHKYLYLLLLALSKQACCFRFNTYLERLYFYTFKHITNLSLNPIGLFVTEVCLLVSVGVCVCDLKVQLLDHSIREAHSEMERGRRKLDLNIRTALTVTLCC